MSVCWGCINLENRILNYLIRANLGINVGQVEKVKTATVPVTVANERSAKRVVIDNTMLILKV